MDGVFVGSGIFKSENPATRAAAIVHATTHFKDPKVLMEVSTGIGPAMVGIGDINGMIPSTFGTAKEAKNTTKWYPPMVALHDRASEIQMYVSSWKH
eukprot:scaffold41643_cov62-Attheya_sp.AAC.4